MELSAVHYSADIPLRGTRSATPWLFVNIPGDDFCYVIYVDECVKMKSAGD
jgi:hypothetical protein